MGWHKLLVQEADGGDNMKGGMVEQKKIKKWRKMGNTDWEITIKPIILNDGRKGYLATIENERWKVSFNDTSFNRLVKECKERVF